MPENEILLVEDNEDDELLTLRAIKLNKIANKIVVARDGQEALDYLFCTGQYQMNDPAGVPNLILLDINLPKISGIEVLQRIRAMDKTRFIPVVILTSSNLEKDIVETYKLGVNSYIIKPVNFDQFVESVKQIGMYWLLLNQAPPAIARR